MSAAPIPVVRVPRDQALPLSLLEEGELLVELRRRPAGFNGRFGIDLKGDLDTRALSSALNELLERHEILRTTFGALRRNGGGSPRFERRIHAHAVVEPALHDLRHLPGSERLAASDRWVEEAGNRPFDYLASPLLRVALLQFERHWHRLLLAVPHLIADARSLLILRDELLTLYRRSTLRATTADLRAVTQYVDFAAWERHRITSAVLRREASHWLSEWQKWGDAQITPTALCKTEPRDLAGHACTRRVLPEDLSAAVRSYARDSGVTLFTVLFATFALLLREYTGASRVAVWSNFANRVRQEFLETVGWFSHARLLGADLSRDPTYRELVRSVYLTVVGALSHQSVPGHVLAAVAARAGAVGVGGMAAGGYVSFDLIPYRAAHFGAQNAKPLLVDGLTVEPVELPPDKMGTCLVVTARDGGDALAVSWEYSRALFHPETVARMAADLERLLRSAVANEQRPVSAFHQSPDRW